MNHAFICDAVRTPIGRYGGVLSSVRTDDLAAIPLARTGGRYAVATMCIGVGQGIATLIERV